MNTIKISNELIFDLISFDGEATYLYYNKLKNNMLLIFLGEKLNISDLITNTPPKMLKYLEDKLESEEDLYVDWYLLDQEYFGGEEEESHYRIYYDFNPIGFMKIPSNVILDMMDAYDESVKPRRIHPQFSEIRNCTVTEIII